MGTPDEIGSFEEYTAGDLTFFIHKEIRETRDLAKGELVIRIEGYGRFTLKLIS
ncbi:MAG: hypothetical protein AB2L14_34005 [Candidatus Xenobiia bacterium LiM19]